MGTIVFLALIALYLLVGWRVATIPFVIREVERCIVEYPLLAKDTREIARWRREALGFGAPLAIVWPFYLAWRTVSARTISSLPITSVEAEAKDRRIEQLERELGLRKEH